MRAERVKSLLKVAKLILVESMSSDSKSGVLSATSWHLEAPIVQLKVLREDMSPRAMSPHHIMDEDSNRHSVTCQARRLWLILTTMQASCWVFSSKSVGLCLLPASPQDRDRNLFPSLNGVAVTWVGRITDEEAACPPLLWYFSWLWYFCWPLLANTNHTTLLSGLWRLTGGRALRAHVRCFLGPCFLF